MTFDFINEPKAELFPSGATMKFFICALLSFFFSLGSAIAQDRQQTDVTPEEAEQLKILQQGTMYLKTRKPQESIASFDKVITFYESKYRDSPDQIYCARSLGETLYYLAKFSTQNPAKNARVVRVWCDAQFLKAYALVELGRLADAKAALEIAVNLSPGNSQYLS